MFVLSVQEHLLRLELESQIKTGFVLRGEALATIRARKLYRDEYDTFDDYCDAVFGFTRLYIKRCLKAAATYRQIERYLKTHGLNDPLPTKQKQLRPIFQARLNSEEMGIVWVSAVTLADGNLPSFSVVSEAVKLYLLEKYPPLNPFQVGQICQILRGVPGKKNCWCVVAKVESTHCLVDTWDAQYLVLISDLAPLKITADQQELMLDLGERMTALASLGELDEAAMWVLRGLEKLNRPLNSLEEKLLCLLEQEYL